LNSHGDSACAVVNWNFALQARHILIAVVISFSAKVVNLFPSMLGTSVANFALLNQESNLFERSETLIKLAESIQSAKTG